MESTSGRGLASFAVAIALMAAADASAQETWTDPQGRFTLQFDQNDWRPSTALRALEGDALMIENDRRGVDDMLLVCKVNERPSPARGAQQDLANAHVRGLSEADVEGIVNGDITDLEHRDVNGMAVVAYSQLLAGFNTEWRVFFLVTAEAVYSVTIMCGARPPVADGDLAATRLVLESLVFPAGACQ